MYYLVITNLPIIIDLNNNNIVFLNLVLSQYYIYNIILEI